MFAAFYVSRKQEPLHDFPQLLLFYALGPAESSTGARHNEIDDKLKRKSRRFCNGMSALVTMTGNNKST